MDEILGELVDLLEDWGHPPGHTCKYRDEICDLTEIVEKYL